MGSPAARSSAAPRWPPLSALAACKSEGASDGGSGSDGQSDGTLSLSVVGLSCINPYNVPCAVRSSTRS